jgi:hypothetical protein
MEAAPMRAIAAIDRYPARLRRPAREPEFEICERCDAEVSTDPESIHREVQCHYCGRYHCTACDLEHSCQGTDRCSKCDRRFAVSKLKLLDCPCDEELCPDCLALHRCPATLGEAVDALIENAAERLVKKKADEADHECFEEAAS